MASPEPASERKRVRTQTQLERKRLADRLKHRENRLETKERLTRIENDLETVGNCLQNIVRLLHSKPLAPAEAPAPALPPTACACQAPFSDEYFDSEKRLISEPPSSKTPLLTSGEDDVLGFQNYSFGEDAPHELIAKASEPSPWTRQRNVADNSLISCRCGLQHIDSFISLDYCSITSLYQGQLVIPHTQFFTQPASHMETFNGGGDIFHPSPSLPRLPSFSALMLHFAEENVLTLLITGILRTYCHKSIQHMLACYLLGYWCMRWRINPNLETIRDVPPWMMPTEVQKWHPHSVVVDYLPWPRLRDYLCTSGDMDPRHSLTFYLESMEFLWPAESPAFVQDKEGKVSISPDFEVAVATLSSWKLGPPWTEAFPHLVHLVND